MKQQSIYLLTLFTCFIYSQAATAQADDLVSYGDAALYANYYTPGATGSYNSAFGFTTMSSNVYGNHNSAVGHEAMYFNYTGSYNTAIGSEAMLYNTSGGLNTATGAYTLYYNTTGGNNTGDGFEALFSNTTGSYNTASGVYALYSNTTGEQNTAAGYESLHNNTTGSNNIAMGYHALYSNIRGNNNVASGLNALYRNTTGSFNTSLGVQSLFSNKSGSNNTAEGYQSLKDNTTGYNNTSGGYQSMFGNTTGYRNTAYGNAALSFNISGSLNTAMGDSAGTAATDLVNTTALGYKARTTASNQVRIGNTSVTSIGGKVGWTTVSDGRYKKDIKEDIPGIAFIKKLRPVSYTLDVSGLEKANGNSTSLTSEERTAQALAAKERHTGFIAQEVEKSANEINYDFGGVDKPKNSKDLYGLRYAEFVVPLVKAVQEQQKQIEQQQQEINDLKDMVNKLMNGQSLTTSKANAATAYLEQNVPNPAVGNTLIRYHLPGNSPATLVLTDVQGSTIKSITLSQGSSQTNVNLNSLVAGVYTYTLYVNERNADSKQLVVGK